MKYDSLMIHYGELTTKGNNRRSFIDMLTHNVRVALKAFPNVEVKSSRDHLYVLLGEEEPMPIISRLQEVPGIHEISLIAKVGREPEEIQKAALDLIQKEAGHTFKIDVRRVDKTYPLRSYDLTVQVADYILDHTSLSVDVHTPDIEMRILLREDGVFLSSHRYPGLGGYPLGMNGKALMLLSGGIDSPVAAYYLLRRGIKIECIHFASPPYTQMAVIDKLVELLGELNEYQPAIRLHIVRFTEIQEAIYEKIPEPYCITIMRRMMLRIASRLAKKEGCLCLATGESIGQVASQTLESLVAINDVTNTPILRPLATADKVAIMDKAREIGTYDISIRPYEDCCTIFKPKKPKTKPKIEECVYYEARFDYEKMIEEALSCVETKMIVEGKEKEFPAK